MLFLNLTTPTLLNTKIAKKKKLTKSRNVKKSTKAKVFSLFSNENKNKEWFYC